MFFSEFTRQSLNPNLCLRNPRSQVQHPTPLLPWASVQSTPLLYSTCVHVSVITTHLYKLSNICGFLIWFWFLYTWGCVYATKPSYYSPPGPSLPRHFQSDTPTYFSSVSLSIWIFIKKTFLVQTWKSPFIFLLQPFHPQTVVNFLNNIVRRKETFREKIFWLCWVSLFSGHSLLLICGQLS